VEKFRRHLEEFGLAALDEARRTLDLTSGNVRQIGRMVEARPGRCCTEEELGELAAIGRIRRDNMVCMESATNTLMKAYGIVDTISKLQATEAKAEKVIDERLVDEMKRTLNLLENQDQESIEVANELKETV
jgi:hypothetical protein